MTHPLRGPVELPRGRDLGCLRRAPLTSSSASQLFSFLEMGTPYSMEEESRCPDVFLAVRFRGISHFSMIMVSLLCWLSVGNDATSLDRGVQGNQASS